MGRDVDVLQGTLNLLILKAISLGPLHGYAVLLRIQQLSGERMVIQQGTLYPALYKLEANGLIAGTWGESDNNRKAKFYTLTAAGRKQFAAEQRRWNDVAAVIGRILGADAAASPAKENA